MDTTTKKCCKCHQDKTLDAFNKCKSGRFGLHNHCRACQKIVKGEWYVKHAEEERAKGKTPEGKAARKKSMQKRYWGDPEFRANFLEKNKLRRRGEAAKVRQRANEKKRRQTNPTYRLRAILNVRLRDVLKELGGTKAAELKELVGCCMSDLIKYIESLWLPGMSWENYGNKEGNWQLDHIIPVCSFNLIEAEQQKACYHYTNVRPLWKIDNLRKGAKLACGTDTRVFNQTPRQT